MMNRLLMAGLFLFPAWSNAQHTVPSQVVVRGTVITSSGDHPAWFTVMCTQGHGGALSFQLMLGTESAPDFPFDAFEGPRAVGSLQPSAVLKVNAQSFAPSSVSGWYSGDTPGAFVFGIASTPGGSAPIHRVAAAIGKTDVTLTWIQQSNDVETPPLIARFTPDAAQTQRLKRITAPCLPR